MTFFSGTFIEIDNHTAPAAFWELTREFVVANSNGCGPRNWKVDLIPDKIGHIDFTFSCRVHDICYHFGRTEEEKRVSDRLLLFNMLADIDNHCVSNGIADRSQRVLYRHLAWLYYRAVSDLGHEAFYTKDKNEQIAKK